MKVKELFEEKSLIHGYEKNLKTIIARRMFMFRAQRLDKGEYISVVTQDGVFQLKIISVSARDSDRESVGGSQLFINLTSDWEGVPNRKRSYFASFNLNHTGMFDGKPSLIIPSDTTRKFAYTPEDFNMFDNEISTEKRKLMELVSNVNHFLNNLKGASKETLSIAGLNLTIDDLNSRLETKNDFPKIDALLKTVGNARDKFDFEKHDRDSKRSQFYMASDLFYGYDDLMKSMEEDGIKSIESAFDSFTPESFNVQVFDDLGKIQKSDSSKHDEIWFEGGFLAIQGIEGWMKSGIIVGILKKIQSGEYKKL